eukprot:1739450-Rhodomonas_salina.2
MSLWDVRKKNSLGRSVLRNAFTLSPSTILPNTLKMSLDGCLDAHRDELEKMSKVVSPFSLHACCAVGAETETECADLRSRPRRC